MSQNPGCLSGIITQPLLTLNCAVIGDSGVGKTKLVCSGATGVKYSLTQLMHKVHTPSIWAIDHYRKDEKVALRSRRRVHNTTISLQLWDTFGQHDQDRTFVYRDADLVLLCFSIVDRITFKNAQCFWLEEIRSLCPSKPVVVVGCKADMRCMLQRGSLKSQGKCSGSWDIKPADIVQPSEGRAFAHSVRAVYYEVSVLTDFGTEELTENIIQTMLVHRAVGQRWWTTAVRDLFIQEPELPPKPVSPSYQAPHEVHQHDFSEFFHSEEFCDLTLEVEGRTLKAHKIILCASSAVLDSIISGSDYSSSLKWKMTHDQSDSLHPNPQHSKSKMNAVLTILNCGLIAVEGVLRFVYCGCVNAGSAASTQLQQLAHELQIPELVALLALQKASLEDQDTRNTRMSLKNAFLRRRSSNMASLAYGRSDFQDLSITLEDGQMSVSRILLASQCDYMKAILTDDFIESAHQAIRFSDVSLETFSTVISALYHGEMHCHPSYTHCLDTMELCDRLCMPDLVMVFEVECINQLKSMSSRGEDIVHIVAQILEPAQSINANQLVEWCLHFLSTSYQSLCKEHSSSMALISERHQAYLAETRWPPAWYVAEMSYYKEITQRQGIIQRSEFSDKSGVSSELLNPWNHAVVGDP